MSDLGFGSLALIFCALAFGGVIKGATGAGTPVIAVPVMAAFFDVRLAVVIMVVPNLVTNITQFWQYRGARAAGGFDTRFAVAGGIGALVGTFALAMLPVNILTLGVAAAVTAYVVLRLARPNFSIAPDVGQRVVYPAGLTAGILQGAAGISAPISVSFLNALRLERPIFVATISMFFTSMSVTQLFAMGVAGLMTPELLGLSALAIFPVLCAMPLGELAARRLSADGFDRLVLALLSVLALRLIYVALF